MTYRSLLERLAALPDEKLDNDVSIILLNRDEVFPAIDFVTDWDAPESDPFGIAIVDGVLDHGHPYLTISD